MKCCANTLRARLSHPTNGSAEGCIHTHTHTSVAVCCVRGRCTIPVACKLADVDHQPIDHLIQSHTDNSHVYAGILNIFSVQIGGRRKGNEDDDDTVHTRARSMHLPCNCAPHSKADITGPAREVLDPVRLCVLSVRDTPSPDSASTAAPSQSLRIQSSCSSCFPQAPVWRPSLQMRTILRCGK